MPAYGEAAPIRPAMCRCREIASNAHRSDIAAEIARPAPAMTEFGTIAPENRTAGKHSMGRASAAWAVEGTAAGEFAPPAPAMTEFGTIAPENRTAGKHSMGRASAAWAVEVTAAEANSP